MTVLDSYFVLTVQEVNKKGELEEVYFITGSHNLTKQHERAGQYSTFTKAKEARDTFQNNYDEDGGIDDRLTIYFKAEIRMIKTTLI